MQDLFLDDEGQEVSYLDVRAGGFLGLGERMFVIPPNVVDGISEERVTLNESRQKVIEEPEYSPDRYSRPTIGRLSPVTSEVLRLSFRAKD